jgi:hypothetical protein
MTSERKGVRDWGVFVLCIIPEHFGNERRRFDWGFIHVFSGVLQVAAFLVVIENMTENCV